MMARRYAYLIAAIAAFGMAMLSKPATADFVQQREKLVGIGAVAAPFVRQGTSIAVSGDGNTALVGGSGDNGSVGATWVFTRTNREWTQQGEKLVGTGTVGNADQGRSVALSADGNTALVGGPSDNGATGAVWVFTRSDGVWMQQREKLIGTGAVGGAAEGTSVALSADGNTALVGGPNDNGDTGAVWVFTRNNGVWNQQGEKLVGTGAGGSFAGQGRSVALSADGNTALVGGQGDNGSVGAAWVFTRTNGVWTQQREKLVGTGGVGQTHQGASVALSADGNTAVIGGPSDNDRVGATWLFTRTSGVWIQQGEKLVGTGAVGRSFQGTSVTVSGDGNTALVGGSGDNGSVGATWVFTRTNGEWSQQGKKLVGTGAVGNADQGRSVALSADGDTALIGGPGDNDLFGAAWAFIQPAPPSPGVAASGIQGQKFLVSPAANIAASGIQGQAFSPTAFSYGLSATSGSLNYAIIRIPSWLNASFTSGTVTTTAVVVTFSLGNLASLEPGTYTATIAFSNESSGEGNTTRTARLIVNRGTKADCMYGGWRNFISWPGPFRNQGQCVRHFAR